MWRNDVDSASSPVVVGGLGGSGTRAVAAILNELDFYIGSYLNPQLDNLWFTFLLRRPASIRSFDSPEIERALKLFDSVMKSYWGKSFKARTQLYELAAEFMMRNYVKRSRYRFPLNAVVSITHHHYHSSHARWGWKEPNTHLFINTLHKQYPNLKYILVMRHPLDLVYGHNFNQLYNWHHLFKLPKPNKRNERALMLEFYDRAYSRSIRIGNELLGSNFMVVKIEELCSSEKIFDRLIEFLEVKLEETRYASIKKIPAWQPGFGRYREIKNTVDPEKSALVCNKFNYSYV